MGILHDFINKFRFGYKDKKFAAMLNGMTPIYSQFGQDIYASDVVQQAISCIVTEMKKLTLLHVKKEALDVMPVPNSDLSKLLKNPNNLMTMSDFIEKITWQLYLNYNSFIIPTYIKVQLGEGRTKKKYTGLYPIQPSNVSFIQDAKDELYVNFQFMNGYETTLRYSDIIHIRYRYSISEFMGGNEFGQPDNKALIKTLGLNETLLNGVAKALNSSFSINGVIKYNSIMDDGKMDAAIAALEKHLENNESGFLPLDMKGEFIPLQKNAKLVDKDTLKFIDEKILRTFGVSLAILTGDYTKDQYEAFYNKCITPLTVSYSQAFSKTLFTKSETGHGNEIKLYPQELAFMDNSQKLTLFDILVDSGSCYKNELRSAFGLYPLPELVGQLAMSSNKLNAEKGEDKDKYTDDLGQDTDSGDSGSSNDGGGSDEE